MPSLTEDDVGPASSPRSRSAYQNGPCAWEIATRWSGIDLDDDPISGGPLLPWVIFIS